LTLHILYNIGYWMFFWGAFQHALELGNPLWSTLFEAPIPHHYIIGAALTYTAYLALTLRNNHHNKRMKQT